jgi:DNA-binding transcriptional MerR regulator
MKHKQASFNFDFPTEETRQVENLAAEPAPVSLTPVDIPMLQTKVEAVSKDKKSTRGRQKLSEMIGEEGLADVPDDAVLFEKSYYSIGAVAEMFKVNQSLIRFWENEFDLLKPKKNGKGDRLFRPEDVKNLKLIYHLLRERKYTIEGAKEYLKKSKHAEKKFELIESLTHLKAFLQELKLSY